MIVSFIGKLPRKNCLPSVVDTQMLGTVWATGSPIICVKYFSRFKLGSGGGGGGMQRLC